MPATARSEIAILAAGVVGGVVLALCASFAINTQYGFAAPLFFVLPLIAALMRLGHLRLFGALYLVLVVSASFVAAIYAAIITLPAVNGSLCIFCSAQEQAANMPRVQITGAVAGFVGSALPFAATTLLGADIRDRKALVVMASAALVLALFGAIALSGALPGATRPLLHSDQANYLLWQRIGSLGPWQLVFGSTLAFVLSRHTPKTTARPAQV